MTRDKGEDMGKRIIDIETREELNIHYWTHIMSMCAGTKASPWECVKIDGDVCTDHPFFDLETNPDKDLWVRYSFSVAIIENKPAFIGDKLYPIYDKGFVRIGAKSSVKYIHLIELNNIDPLIEHFIDPIELALCYSCKPNGLFNRIKYEMKSFLFGGRNA